MSKFGVDGEIQRVEYRGAHSEVDAQVKIPALKCAAVGLASSVVLASISVAVGAIDLVPSALLAGLVVGAAFAMAYFGRDLFVSIERMVETVVDRDLDGDGAIGTRGEAMTETRLDELAKAMIVAAHGGKAMSRRSWADTLTPDEHKQVVDRLYARGVVSKDRKHQAVLIRPTVRESLDEYNKPRRQYWKDADGDIRAKIV